MRPARMPPVPRLDAAGLPCSIHRVCLAGAGLSTTRIYEQAYRRKIDKPEEAGRNVRLEKPATEDAPKT